MERIIKHIIATAALLLLGVGTAKADPISIDPAAAGTTVDADCETCSMNAELASNLDLVRTMLDVGEEWTFDFFDILVGVSGTSNFSIDAMLTFTEPEITVEVSGSGEVFNFVTIAGRQIGGSLTWVQPDDLVLDDGSLLSFTFEDLDVIGVDLRTTASVTVGRHASLAVSEPGTLWLLSAGLLGLGLYRRLPA